MYPNCQYFKENFVKKLFCFWVEVNDYNLKCIVFTFKYFVESEYY